MTRCHSLRLAWSLLAVAGIAILLAAMIAHSLPSVYTASALSGLHWTLHALALLLALASALSFACAIARRSTRPGAVIACAIALWLAIAGFMVLVALTGVEMQKKELMVAVTFAALTISSVAFVVLLIVAATSPGRRSRARGRVTR